jgi:hypothetical protein
MQNEFISRETFWIAGLLPAFFAGQVSTQLRCKKRPPHTLLRT